MSFSSIYSSPVLSNVHVCRYDPRGSFVLVVGVGIDITYEVGRYEKRYHMKPPLMQEKNAGYHHLTTNLLQPNSTLLDTITSDLSLWVSVTWYTFQSWNCTPRALSLGWFTSADTQPVCNDLTSWRLNQGCLSIPEY